MKIIKKKVRNKEYYYLKHSFRIDGRIINKEEYLGNQIPKNIGERVYKFNKKNSLSLEKKLISIKRHFQSEWKKTPPSAKEKELKEIALAFTYNTNAIEGSKITLEEVREIVENNISPNKPLRDVKEAEEHNRVFLSTLKKKEKISSNLLLKWHKDIFGQTKQDIAGKFREHLVRVGNYLAPDWQDVPRLMKEFVYFILKNRTSMNPVELSARTHYRFEKIHPFADGNGRIGRLLMNYILWHKKYPMLIIEYKKRKSYYKALNRDEEKFVQYFFRRYLAVHKNRIKN